VGPAYVYASIEIDSRFAGHQSMNFTPNIISGQRRKQKKKKKKKIRYQVRRLDYDLISSSFSYFAGHVEFLKGLEPNT
jgi:hypothetical protein